MEFVLLWIGDNWQAALQGVGIVAGLFFTGSSFRQSVRVQRVQTLISLTQQHRSIWLKFFDSPKLKRIFTEKARSGKVPTADERLFVNLIFLHLASTLVAVKYGVIDKPAGADDDYRDILRFPIPRQVWNETKQFHDKETVRYIESLLNSTK